MGIYYRVPISWRDAGCQLAERTRNATSHQHALERRLGILRQRRDLVAKLVVEDTVYLPIFSRMDDEVAAAEARLLQNDPLEMARALVATQSAKRR